MTTKEKPIIFSTPSIPSIQNLKPGTWPPEPIDPGKPWKCMTRRIIKAPVLSKVRQPDEVIFDGNVCEFAWHGNDVVGGFKIKCPYPPGTRLWVRETWQKNYCNEAMVPNKYAYKASPETWIYFSEEEKRLEKKWRPSIFMPREAARLFLRVKNVRVERLQAITEKDAIAEGCITFQDKLDGGELLRGVTEFDLTARDAYADLWDSINGKKHPWASNPYVWVYEFMRRERQ